ncbi:hypothetical protein HFK74_15710|uniref:hypothetical protein n=1 Tax=Pseudomonas sp. SbOxS1 TaxID=2723884 RepID=UPI0015D2F86B|nr:hypothetical protein [Pseudomonas sp. SbOxS1]NYU04151.1 hypothetical protein [Pseudomonas sp. SbOxS1]
MNAELVWLAQSALDVLLAHADDHVLIDERCPVLIGVPHAGLVPAFSIASVFSFRDESSHFHVSGARSRLFRKRLFQPRFFNVFSRQSVYDCARQPRRGFWITSMDLPSSYSIPRFSNHELTD